MAYTQNESIDGLTAITPTTDDIVVTMDQAEIGVAKTSTLLSIYNLFKTTYDTIYAKYLGDADFYQYSIVPSIVSNELVITVVNYLGSTPSANAPIKYRDRNGVIRTITSALTLTENEPYHFDLGRTGLNGKETDLFVYFILNGTSTNIGLSRCSHYNSLSDMPAWAVKNNEKYIHQSGNSGTESMVLIGRVNAIFTTGVWTLPATSRVENRPVNFTRWLQGDVILSGSTGSVGTYAETAKSGIYKIEGDKITQVFGFKVTNIGSWTGDSRIKTIMSSSLTSNVIVGSGGLMNGNNGTFSNCLCPYLDDTEYLNLANNFGVNWGQYSDITANDYIMGHITYNL